MRWIAGRRATDWELKGVPLRVDIGPREVRGRSVTLMRRDDGAKRTVAVDALVERCDVLLADIQRDMTRASAAHLDNETRDVESINEMDGSGMFRLPVEALGDDGEDELAERGYTVRCLVTRDGRLPRSHDDEDLTAYVARAY